MPAPPVCPCKHPTDDHVLAIVPTTHPAPMGVMYCPVPGCACANTWRAGTRPSTQEEIAQTRVLIREALARDGIQVPEILR